MDQQHESTNESNASSTPSTSLSSTASRMSASRRLAHAAVLGLGVFAGLLMWSRLKIVTDTPRSAYAEPRAVEPAAGDTPAAPSADEPRADSKPVDAAASSEKPATP